MMKNAHDWLSFEDPEEDRTWLLDVTFLLSNWQCIFGAGCQGVLTGEAPELEQGCCSYGAHFTGSADVKRVRKAAARLRPADWQFYDKAHRKDDRLAIITKTDDGTKVTAQADGACIFLNRPGWPGGSGCALHGAALAHGERPMDWKPDVCWQLPLRREDETDAAGHVTSVVTQWDRRHWGEGGAEFAWWCTEAPEAFTGTTAVYQSMAGELEELIGTKVYRLLVDELDRRAASEHPPRPHPASVPLAPPRRRARNS
ncbi:MAG: hypothetical protein ACYDH6_02620 [Acidimicrobiales bacterium]